MQLIGPDPPPPDRSGVLFLTDVAPRTSVGTIAQRFAAAGLAVPLQVVFIGRGVCRVVTSKSDGGAAAAREKLRAIGLGAEMLTLEEYRARQAMDRATAAAATAALAAAEARALAEEAAGVAAAGRRRRRRRRRGGEEEARGRRGTADARAHRRGVVRRHVSASARSLGGRLGAPLLNTNLCSNYVLLQLINE